MDCGLVDGSSGVSIVRDTGLSSVGAGACIGVSLGFGSAAAAAAVVAVDAPWVDIGSGTHSVYSPRT